MIHSITGYSKFTLGKKIVKNITFLILIANYTFSQSNISTSSIHTESVFFSLKPGVTYSITDYNNPTLGFIAGGSSEYYFYSFKNHLFGIGLTGGIGTLAGEQSNFQPANFSTNFTALGLLGYYGINISDIFVRFGIGIENIWFDPDEIEIGSFNSSGKVNFEKSSFGFVFELGGRYFFDNNWGGDLSFSYHMPSTDWLDGANRGSANDVFAEIKIGIVYKLDLQIRTKSEKPLISEPIEIENRYIDSDSDGVEDIVDKCPGTPLNVIVDETGCPKDSDQDGVADYIDICPDTPMQVDVDKYGCPLDSDKDGVPNYLDECENTLPGESVDEKGCSQSQLSEMETIIIHFEFGSANINRIDYILLDQLVKKLKEEPLSRWLIEGYISTDEAKQGYKNLALERASFIKSYFVKKDFDQYRFDISAREEIFISDNSENDMKKIVMSKIR